MTSALQYTSEFVCDRIAERNLKEFRADQFAAAAKFSKLLSPIAAEVQTGKLKRGSVRMLSERLANQLRNEPAITELTLHQLTPSRLSTHEAAHIRFSAMGSDEAAWAQFITTDIDIQRKSIRLAVSGIDVLIHRHALSRYMQRERCDSRALMNSILPAIKMAGIIAYGQARHPERNIAIPVGGGLLLGRFSVADPHKNPPTTLRAVVGRNVFGDYETVSRATPVDGARTMVKFITYADADLLSDNRRDLHRILTEFGQRYDRAINTVFDVFNFDEAYIETDDIDSIKEEIGIMLRGVEDVIGGTEWQQFLDSVRQRD